MVLLFVDLYHLTKVQSELCRWKAAVPLVWKQLTPWGWQEKKVTTFGQDV